MVTQICFINLFESEKTHFTSSTYFFSLSVIAFISFLNYVFISHESFKRVYFFCRDINFKFAMVTEKFEK